MSRPSTPSRSSLDRDAEPPSYFNTSLNEAPTPSRPPGTSSTMRLLPNGNDAEYKAYVQTSIQRDEYPASRKRKLGLPKATHVTWEGSLKQESAARAIQTPNPFTSLLLEAEESLQTQAHTVIGRASTLKATVTLRKYLETDRSPSYRASRISPERYFKPAASTVHGSRPGSR